MGSQLFACMEFGLRVHEVGAQAQHHCSPRPGKPRGSQGGWEAWAGRTEAEGEIKSGHGTKGPPEMAPWAGWTEFLDLTTAGRCILWDLRHKPSGGLCSEEPSQSELWNSVQAWSSVTPPAPRLTIEASDRSSQNHRGSEGIRAESQGISLRDPEFGTIWKSSWPLKSGSLGPPGIGTPGWHPLIHLTLPMPSLVLWLFQLCHWPSENSLVFQIIL